MDPTTTPPQKFFNFNFCIQNGVPKFSATLKQEFKTKQALKRSDGRPISASVEGYFTYYLGESDGASAYAFYKEFFNKRRAIDYGIANGIIDSSLLPAIQRYFEEVDVKTKANHAAVVATEEYRAKLRKSSNRKANAESRAAWWALDGNKAKMKKVLNNPIVAEKKKAGFQKWLESGGRETLIDACNKPDRVEKISRASKQMWAEARSTNNLAKLDKWFKGRYAKKHVFNDIRMNKPESELAKILARNRLEFAYEPPVKVDDVIFYPDFVVDGMIFECYGDYWHANPKNHSASDLVYGEVTAAMIWERDRIRADLLETAGYKVVVFWETELLCEQEKVNSKIEKEINEKRKSTRSH
jgi:G:T-mismatch repair DNA endonuclease (very short patch repair protein)